MAGPKFDTATSCCRGAGTNPPERALNRKVRLWKLWSSAWALFEYDVHKHTVYSLSVFGLTSVLARAPFANYWLWFLVIPLTTGPFAVALKRAQGHNPSFRDFFLSPQQYLVVLFGVLVSCGMIMMGLMILVIPGLYLAVSYQLLIPFMLDRSHAVWEAMEMSRKHVTAHLLESSTFFLAVTAGNVGAASISVYLLIITLPLTACGFVGHYDQVICNLGVELYVKDHHSG